MQAKSQTHTHVHYYTYSDRDREREGTGDTLANGVIAANARFKLNAERSAPLHSSGPGTQFARINNNARRAQEESDREKEGESAKVAGVRLETRAVELSHGTC